jgi:hypothetical protein
MMVTKALIEDLLPLYAAGEVSEETRKIVDEFLAGDADLRARLKAAVAQALPRVSVPAGVETKSILETRRLIKNKNHLWGLAFGLSYLSMTFAFNSEKGLVFLMARDLPQLALLFCTFGLFSWFLLIRMDVRMRATGLVSGKNPANAVGWAVASLGISAPLAMTLSQWIGGPWMVAIQLAVAVVTFLVWRS